MINRSPFSTADEYFMQEAIDIAEAAMGRTWPNPGVGCIITKDNRIIAHASTADQGRPHAETIAIENASEDVEGSIMYITLEPCVHTARTPPCVDNIIKSKIKKVVIGAIDPNPKVNGKGIKALEAAGITVKYGVCEKNAVELIYGFKKRITHNKPYVTLKLAISIDGKIALSNGKSKWITNEQSRNLSHVLRAKNNAILVGINTILADNPTLTCRAEHFSNPYLMRVVLDTHLKTPIHSKIIQTADKYPTTILKSDCTNCHHSFHKKKLKIDSVSMKENQLDLNAVLEKLANIGINNLLIEGGSKVFTSFLKENLVDKIIIFQAKKIIGNDGIPAIGNLGIEDLNFSPKVDIEIIHE